MRVMQIPAPGADFQLIEREIPDPHAGEVLIKVEACGVCRGDVLAKGGTFPGLQYPRVPGHEVVGTIDRVGRSVTRWKEGDKVGVGWHGGHCFACNPCRQGDFHACDSAQTTGLTRDGGYAEYMLARAEALLHIPQGITAIAAAPLLCAGNTVFTALQQCRASPGDLVAVHGLGGLGHLAVQFAVRMGFRVAVLSRGREKDVAAYELGADLYIDADGEDPAAELRAYGGAKLILCTAPDSDATARLVAGLSRHGELMLVAFTHDSLVIPASKLLLGERSITGVVGGNHAEQTILFSQRRNVSPIVEAFPLERASEAYERMLSTQVRFRAVLVPGP